MIPFAKPLGAFDFHFEIRTRLGVSRGRRHVHLPALVDLR